MKNSRKIARKAIITEHNITRRMLAAMIDYSIFGIFFFVDLMLFGEELEAGKYEGSGISSLPIILFWITYFPISESALGKTFGKLVLKLQVTTLHGSKITLTQAVKRMVSDSFELTFYGIPAMITVKNTPHHQRVGDLWAKTLVMTNKELEDTLEGRLQVS